MSLNGATVNTSTGGTSGSPLDWSNSATWSAVGSGTPHVYIIRSGDFVKFDNNNSSPYVDTLFIYGDLIVANNKVMTLTGSGVIQLMNNAAAISGGSSNTQFAWNGTGATLSGPFTSGNIVTNGPRYATAATVAASGGNIQTSFVSGMLPLGLVNFRAICDDGKMTVDWSTTNETGVKEFQLFKSTLGSDWDMVHRTMARGTSGVVQEYSYSYVPDKNATEINKGTLVLFRLKWMYEDSAVEDGKIIYTRCSNNNWGNFAEIQLAPNPVVDNLEMFSADVTGLSGSVYVYSETGVQWKEIDIQKATVNNKLVIFLGDLPAGIYQVKVISSTLIQSKLIIKQ